MSSKGGATSASSQDAIQNVNGVLVTPWAAVRPSDAQFLCVDEDKVFAGLLFGDGIVKVHVYTHVAQHTMQERHHIVKRLAEIVVPDDEQPCDEYDDTSSDDDGGAGEQVTIEKEAATVAAAIEAKRQRRRHRS